MGQGPTRTEPESKEGQLCSLPLEIANWWLDIIDNNPELLKCQIASTKISMT